MRGRLTERLPAERREQAAIGVLAGLLVVGASVRLWLMLSVRPALIGYADSYTYIGAAHGSLFGDPLRPAGYSVFLRLMHELNANLSFTILAQHALGLVSAVLLYLAARCVGISRWWSLLPAGVVALAGPQIMIEHTPLTEGFFVFLQSAALYAAARAVGERDWGWALAAGAIAGASVTVRALGIFLVAVIALCLLVLPPATWRRLARVAATLAVVLLVVGVYVFAQERETGFTGLTRAGSWNLYGRVGPFADCDKFDPPAGTRRLCEDTPDEERRGPNDYIFNPETSPAIQAFGTPFTASQENNEKVAAFARAALVHQPLDWLEDVFFDEMPRYVQSSRILRPGVGLDFDGLQDNLLGGFQAPQTAVLISTYYSTTGEYRNPDRLETFLKYERVTRVTGVLFALLALLAVAGAILGRRELGRGALLFIGVALVSILGPPMTLFYDARYAIPAFGPLAAVAAIGGAALTGLIRAKAALRGRVATS